MTAETSAMVAVGALVHSVFSRIIRGAANGAFVGVHLENLVNLER